MSRRIIIEDTRVFFADDPPDWAIECMARAAYEGSHSDDWAEADQDTRNVYIGEMGCALRALAETEATQ